MKTLIVYYSLTGNVKFIAETMAKTIDADLLELKLTEKDINPKGFMKFLWGGKQVFSKKHPDLLPFDKNPQDYDLLIIGTPVWAWTYAPALRTFFANTNISNKKIALFCCHGGGKGQTLQKMKAVLGDNNFMGEIDFFEPLKKDTQAKEQRAIEWARETCMLDQYFLNREVVIMPYDDQWLNMFDAEKAKILTAVHRDIIVEHIGSTSIPGLAAKPIIDIMIGTKNLSMADICIKPLETIDYEYIPQFEEKFPARRFLHRGPNLPNQHYHLHMVARDSDFWHDHLFFRDYLRTHKQVMMDYQTLKEDLAKKYKNDVGGYCEAKSEFIQNILKKKNKLQHN
ncbi:MAG: hypothetical protein A3C55_02905 [Gammaproteobacteria bacterium RIFCSPHIGHO2_02_FULL_42_13]|nr:MAG: hypothetical protein A3C55_02905 [Gammaproteobacteria bacterium RIFCSPHIGHO2_02_FULL_42_13]OGT68171.1 MAG: hypothetical protein A3H43_02535 [Gammaproteobacteria bacterium RIFCSPLOWO2_02_FULL_42_9]